METTKYMEKTNWPKLVQKGSLVAKSSWPKIRLNCAPLAHESNALLYLNQMH